MAKITEQDVVSFLKEKEQRLSEELNRTREALKALASDPIVQEQKNGRSDVKQAKPVQRKTKKGRKSNPKPLEAAKKFDPKGTLDSKIAFALFQTGPVFKEDIVQSIAGLQPELDSAKLKGAVTQRLSYLNRKGLIGGVKEGRKHRYSLTNQAMS